MLPLLLALPAAAQADAAPVTTLAVVEPQSAEARVVTAGGRVVVDVTCPGGIGGLTLRRTPRREPWPERLVVRLRGFETLEHVDARTALRSAERELGCRAPRVWAAGRGTWAAVDATDRDAMPIQREAGWIDVTIPTSLLDPAADSIRLRWIDAYRR